MASKDMVDVIAIMTPKPDKWGQVAEILHNLAESVKAHEPDAYRYQVFQDKNEGPELVVIEQYKDRAAFEAHHGSEHFQAAGKKMKEQDLLAKAPEVKVLGALAGYASK